MSNQIVKYIDCIGEYDEFSHSNIIYKIPIYDIPLNKKGFCQPFVQMETKEGVRSIPRCAEYFRHKNCSKCVTSAKKLYRMNHEKE